MGFTRPDHATMAAARDQAETDHKAYWSENGNGYQPTGKFFPGFEKGWNDACDKLEKGEDLGDIEAETKNAAGGDPDAWEYEHGYKRGAEEAQKAGSN